MRRYRSIVSHLRWGHKLTPQRGAIALSSRGDLGLITDNKKAPIVDQDGKSTEAWVGISLGQDPNSPAWTGLWSSREPRVVGILDQREYDVLLRYFGIDGQKPLSLRAIGERWGVTHERVRQVRQLAIRKILYHINLAREGKE